MFLFRYFQNYVELSHTLKWTEEGELDFQKENSGGGKNEGKIEDFFVYSTSTACIFMYESLTGNSKLL